jgi:molybdate transport system substrate-binding protein
MSGTAIPTGHFGKSEPEQARLRLRKIAMPRRAVLALAVVIAAIAAPPAHAQAQDKSIIVFAAASLKNVIDDLNHIFSARTGVKVVASYAATSALVRQIEQGAPADIFISADAAWMDYAAKNKLLKPGTRFDLAGNRLVLIAPKDSQIGAVTITPGFDLAKLAGDSRIVTGDVRAVPAGKYAKAALDKLGIWKTVEPKVAMAENVRAALALVARGEAALGIVYETDAKIEPNVKIVGHFPAGSHPPIVYPAAQTIKAKPTAARYLAYLHSGTAVVGFERYGFTYLVKAGP